MPPKKQQKGDKSDASNSSDASDVQVLLLQKFEDFSIQLKDMQVSMHNMQQSIDTVKDDVKSLKELHEVVKDVKITADNAMKATETNSKEVDRLSNELKKAQQTITVLDACCKNLNEDLIQQDAYSRRDNLLFENVPESPQEDCCDVMKKLFVESLKMDQNTVEQMKIVRCHRLGKPKAGLTRTMICRFHFFGDRQLIWKQRTNLKGSNLRMKEDFPKQIVARRNTLAPIMFEARRQQMNAHLVVDTLYIDNQPFTVNNLDALPEALDISKLGSKKISDRMLAFYGANCPLSNFHYAPFSDGVNNYFGTEQYLHYQKALLFKDSQIAARILAAKTPLECKSLGRSIDTFDIDIWKNHAKDIMLKGQMMKFRQNKLCYKALASTGNLELVEASPFDKLWGAGCGMNNPDLKNKQLWKGTNWMGEVLHSVRSELIG